MSQRMIDAQYCGFLAYAALSSHARLVKDAYMSNEPRQVVAVASMGHAAFDTFLRVASHAEANDFDLYVLMQPAWGLVDELEARLRPGDWAERVVKTYVTFGMLADYLRAAASGAEVEIVTALGEVDWSFGHEQWARDYIHTLCAGDDQLRQRLSLWGRRVFGEALGMSLGIHARYPNVGAAVAPDAEKVVAMLQTGHGKRMAKAGLAG